MRVHGQLELDVQQVMRLHSFAARETGQRNGIVPFNEGVEFVVLEPDVAAGQRHTHLADDVGVGARDVDRLGGRDVVGLEHVLFRSFAALVQLLLALLLPLFPQFSATTVGSGSGVQMSVGSNGVSTSMPVSSVISSSMNSILSLTTAGFMPVDEPTLSCWTDPSSCSSLATMPISMLKSLRISRVMRPLSTPMGQVWAHRPQPRHWE